MGLEVIPPRLTHADPVGHKEDSRGEEEYNTLMCPDVILFYFWSIPSIIFVIKSLIRISGKKIGKSLNACDNAIDQCSMHLNMVY